MNKLELSREIAKLELKIKQSTDLNEKLELGKKLGELCDKLSKLMDEEKEAEPFISAKELLSKPEPIIEAIPSGIKLIDDNLGGIIKGAFIQIAAASGAGKTTLMVKILSSIAKSAPVVHFDFEMGQIKLYRILKNYLKSDKQKENYKIDTTHSKLNDLLSRIKLGISRGIEIFLIDSRMKIETDEKDTYKSASLISHELSKLTKDYNITIILINQVSEEALATGRPSLKGSGDQVYDSDVILFIQRYIKKKEKKEDIPETDETKRRIICTKNRFGELFSGDIYKSEVLSEPNYEQTQTQVINEPQINMPDIQF